jgi:hypothetical protein
MNSPSLAWNFLAKLKIPDEEKVKQAFQQRLSDFDIDNITVDEVTVDADGDILVFLSDVDGDEMLIVFIYDEDEGAMAIIQDDDEDAEDTVLIDLDALAPPIIKTAVGSYIDLTDLNWLNKSALTTLLQAGNVVDSEDEDEEEEPTKVPDPYGYVLNNEDFQLTTEDEIMSESRKVYVIRGGKKVKLAIVRKVRRRVLTGKQKTAIRKAVRSRKVKKAQIKRKLKRSLRIRKRLHVKRPKNLSRFQKVQGTANRKR